MSAPDPTAGERRHDRCCAAGITNGAARCQCVTPDADDASEPLTEAERASIYATVRGYDEDQHPGPIYADVERIKAAAATKARADERKAAWDWFGEMLKAHQYEGQPIWDEYQADRRSLLVRDGGR